MRNLTPVTIVLACLLLAAIVWLSGCPKSGTAEKPAATSAAPPAGGAAAAAGPAKTEMASCPVLGTTMAKSQMIPYEYKGKTYYFCCQDCVKKFKANPEKYIKHPAPPQPAGAPMSH